MRRRPSRPNGCPNLSGWVHSVAGSRYCSGMIRGLNARPKFFALACGLLGVVIGVGADRWVEPTAVAAGAGREKSPPADYSRYRKLDAFARALAIVERHYVRPVDGDALIHAAMSGMVAELDPHTRFLDPAAAHMLQQDVRGKFGGVGLVVNLVLAPVPPGNKEEPNVETEKRAHRDADDAVAERVLAIRDVIPGGPAAKIGLVVGDEVTHIEGKPVSNFVDLGAAILMMRGEPGTAVTFTIRHKRGSTKTYTVKRAVVEPPAVEVRYLGEGIGSLRLRDFQEASSREMKKGLDALDEQASDDHDHLRGVVIDLRDNGGGLLSEAIRIVDLFVSKGRIVATRGRDGQTLDEARAHRAGTNSRVSVVVLINKASASASEIVAGALQDHRRALILGERSYGKGSVQAPFDLGDGSVLKLTTSLYYTPDDRLIQASGIVPDIEVGTVAHETKDSRPELRPERDQPRHLEPKDFGRSLPMSRSPGAAVDAAGSDVQLATAVEHLQVWDRLQGRDHSRARSSRGSDETSTDG